MSYFSTPVDHVSDRVDTGGSLPGGAPDVD